MELHFPRKACFYRSDLCVVDQPPELSRIARPGGIVVEKVACCSLDSPAWGCFCRAPMATIHRHPLCTCSSPSGLIRAQEQLRDAWQPGAQTLLSQSDSIPSLATLRSIKSASKLPRLLVDFSLRMLFISTVWHTTRGSCCLWVCSLAVACCCLIGDALF